MEPGMNEIFALRGFVAEALREQGYQQGITMRTLRHVLEARGVPLPEEAWQRVSSCRDSELLDLWLRRALTVSSAEEIFGGPEAPEGMREPVSDADHRGGAGS